MVEHRMAGDLPEGQDGMELLVAQMENRLRATIMELLQPTIQRTSHVVVDVETIKGIVTNHQKGLNEMQMSQFKSLEQVRSIQTFKEEMVRWDTQRRTHEASLDEKMEAMHQKLDLFKYNLEQKESALHHLHRNVDRTAAELNRVMEEQEVQKEHSDSRYDEQSKKLNLAKAQLDIRIAGLEMKHSSLTDELWGEETGLAKVAGELKKTNTTLSKLEAAMEAVQRDKAEASQLDELRAEVGRMLKDANASVASMQQAVGNVINDVQEHFRTASETISSHNAAFIGEVRTQYNGELERAAKVRGEVQEFMAQMTKNISVLDARVAEAANRAGALATEAREEIEELNKRRKRDKTSADNELKTLKKRLGGVFDNNDAMVLRIEHMYSVLQIILDSDFVQSAVDLQDSTDRHRIALMGVKDEETTLARTTHSEPQRPRPEYRAKSAPTGTKPEKGTLRGGPGTWSSAKNPQEPTMRVDNRCLSCSGQAPLVLSAFKIACLQYNPSPVEYEGRPCDRSDLLEQRHQLLERARNSLNTMQLGKVGGALLGSTDAETTGAGGGNTPEDSGTGDVFSAYAAVESWHQQGKKAQARPRLPTVPGKRHGSSEHRPMTVR